MAAKRNVSLDLFRVIIMFMIVLGHSLVHGGILEKTELFTPSYYMSNTLMIFLYVHVNCFVILSGYFGCNKDFSFSKWAKLWAQVFFWSVALYFFSYKLKELVKSLLPFTQQRYWFMTTYLLMYLLTPLLNKIIQTINIHEYRKGLLVYFSVFILLQNMVPWREFTGVNHLSPLFFCFLYMIGGYFRNYPPNRKINWLMIYIGSCIIRCLYFFGISAITYRYLGESLGETLLNGYCSFLTVIGAVALFMTFATIKANFNEQVTNLLTFLSPLTLGVYLIHGNPSMRSIIWNNLGLIKFIDKWYLLPMLLFISVLIFVVCFILEWVRTKLFSFCKLDLLASAIGQKLDALLNRAL